MLNVEPSNGPLLGPRFRVFVNGLGCCPAFHNPRPASIKQKYCSKLSCWEMDLRLMGAGGTLVTGITVMRGTAPMPVRSLTSLPTCHSFPQLGSATSATSSRGFTELSCNFFSQLCVSLICPKMPLLELQCFRYSEADRSVFCTGSALSRIGRPMKMDSRLSSCSTLSSFYSRGMSFPPYGSTIPLSPFGNPFVSTLCVQTIRIEASKSSNRSKVDSRSSDARCSSVLSGSRNRWMSSTPRENKQLVGRQVGSKVDDHDSNEARTENVERVRLALDSVHTGVEDNQADKEQTMSRAFNQGALDKIKEDDQSALPMIEDTRRKSARDPPMIDSSTLFSEPNERHGSEIRKTRMNSEGIRNQVVLKGSRSIVRGTKPGKFFTSSLENFDSLPAKSRTNDRVKRDRNLSSAESAKFSIQEPKKIGLDSLKDNGQSSKVVEPILVKRSTVLPVHWNWHGGVVLLVDKPEGWTSFAVCSRLRYLLKIQKVGHAGTLDPMATGLLIICLGKATKVVDSYQAMTKMYSGTFRLGELTPSLDSHTEVSDVLPWEHITDEELERATKSFIGDIMQRPPMYSAIQINGERLYKKARKGEEIEIPPRLVSVTDFQLERSSKDRQEVDFRVTCSKGTYVRSLCRDLADVVGCYAHLTSLRREKIGTYDVKDAWPILELVEQCSGSTDCASFKTKF